MRVLLPYQECSSISWPSYFSKTTHLDPRPIWSWVAPIWVEQPWLVPVASPALPQSAHTGPGVYWSPPLWSLPRIGKI